MDKEIYWDPKWWIMDPNHVGYYQESDDSSFDSLNINNTERGEDYGNYCTTNEQ